MANLTALALRAKFMPLASTIKTLHYVVPALTFFTFVITLTLTVCTLQTQSLRVRDQRVRRDIILGTLFVVVSTYLAEVAAIFTKSWTQEPWFPGQDHIVYLLASSIIFGLQILLLSDTKFPVWYPYYATWFIGLIAEFTLIIANCLNQAPQESFDFVLLFIQSFRILSFVVLPSLYFGHRNSKEKYDLNDAERQSLLRKKLAPKATDSENGNEYGATTDSTQQKSGTADDSSEAGSEDSWLEWQRKSQELITKRLKNDGNWWTYAKGFMVFFPHIWPVHNKRLQFRAALVGCCLLTTNALNVLVPRQLGIMIDTLSKYSSGGDTTRNIWLAVITYTILSFLSGGACIGWLRKWLWVPLEQYSYDALSTASHAHIMSLSSDFHDAKTSSELSQAIAGGRSVSDLLETVCFQVIPMLINLSVAFGYLWSLFGPYMGFILAVTVTSYLYTTTKLVSRRAEQRRHFVTVSRREWTVGQQSLDGWNTASLFNMIPYERNRYEDAVKDHLKARGAYELSSQTIIAAQGFVMTLGLLGALYLAVYQVIQGNKTVGQFATLITYWGQLQGPLSFFSSMYKSISYSLMDAERLLELFETKPSIKDTSHAKPLKLGQGKVEFDQVCFAYDDRKPNLKNISFTAPPGKTVALVGETGGGKSTILKLIDRFYDVKSGSIKIDGQDIRDVTLESLRSKIGVVPQDPMLFNDTIMSNLRYARLTASNEEVYEACKAAAIHDKVMSFPNGYNSKVGDRGVKLSGGEKQRIAIARAILKQPELILLDEATSAVDTETEQLIQKAIRVLCHDRTTFIVAHRLSTIMRADHILVVMDGEVIEGGSHDALLSSKGKYFDLWTRQIFLKPTTERHRSRSPKKQSSIINDLTPASHKAEIEKAKIQHKAQTSKAKKEVSVPNTDGNSSDFDDEEDGHTREGSRLKPDAPEFIPRSSDHGVPNSLAKEPAKKFKDQSASSNGSGSAAGQKEEAGGNESNGPDKLRQRRARNSRRQHAKSEPSRVQDSTDGAQDSEIAMGSSSEGLAMTATQGRRVSAPSDPPAGPQDTRGSRPRRNRHWRLKNRAAENRSVDSTSATTSGGTSTDNTASHEGHNTTPMEASTTSMQTGTVRFAPVA
ncbi:ABC transporter [Phlyctema vagabunda]|uniref:ABC transporter n=1 Tax=Phlyctema vagabunda TaxID=108571 RepID=A0ABR4PYA2_9HELO